MGRNTESPVGGVGGTRAARKQGYLSGTLAILAALSTPAYLAEGTTNSAILLHGTNYKPGGDYDTGLLWGDYYFLEALLRAQPVVLTSGSAPAND